MNYMRKTFKKYCLNCNTEFEVTSKNKSKKFCCRSCANGYNQRQRFTEDESLYCDGLNSFNSYVLGLIVSDGCLSYCKHTRRYRITITLNDLEVIQAIHDIWTPKKSIYTYNKSNSVVSNNACDIDFVQKMGITERKSATIQMPSIPKQYFGAFLRGVFDGDGSVYVNKTTSNGKFYYYVNCSIVSGSLKFLEQLQAILKNDYKIHSTINKDVRCECWSLRVRVKSSVKKMFDLMYQDGGLCLMRKKNKFNL